MNQKGLVVNQSRQIDSLVYGYFLNTNRLKYVTDLTNDTSLHLGDFTEINNITTQDYWYDGNGNMMQDKNKNISNISYNFLNLPETIAVTGKGTIVYTYDAAGNKLKKTTVDNTVSPAKTTVTDYLGPFIYQNDTLQFVVTEEGRARLKSPGVSDTVLYDYFEKDHLGNTRIVLTDQLQTDAYPPASLEQAGIANEKIFYSGLENGIVNKNTVAAYPNDPYTNPNDFIQKLKGDNVKIGTGMLLKVMSGDKLNVHASVFYRLNGATPDPPVSPLPDILFSLINGIPGISGNKLTTMQLGNGVLNPSVGSFLNTRDATANNNRPRAWLNIIVFDEQMNMVMTNDGKNSYFEQAGATNVLKVFNITNREITKNGYVYIYVSNETPNVEVYFDNLQVTDIRSPLIEEEHYYGFGSKLAGISSESLIFGQPENKKLFNGKQLENKEFSDGSGLEWYDYGMREYDQQIGRFFRVDPISEKFFELTPYQYASNNPITNIDLDGLEGMFFQDAFNLAVSKVVENPNSGTSKAIGAAVGVGASVQKTITGVGNVLAHPINTLKGIMNLNTPEGAVNMAISVSGKINAYQNGTGFEKSAIISEAVTDVATAIVGTKGIGTAVKGTEAAGIVGDATYVTKTAGQLGKEGMAAAGIEQNTTRIPSLTGTAKYRVPDGLDLPGKTLSEVKNVAKQSLTNQVKDYIQYSQQNGLNFELHIRQSTQLSKPLQQQVLKGTVKLKFPPGL